MYLFDTMIVSYMLRADPILKMYQTEMEADGPQFLSCQSVGEIYYGAWQKNWGKSRLNTLAKFLENFSVLPIDGETSLIYGEVRSTSDSLGRRLLSQDAWILATAKQYGLTLISHDRDMFVARDLGVPLISKA